MVSSKDVVTITGKDQNSKSNPFLKNCISKAIQGSNWVWRDLKKPHLLWVKIIFMLQSASLVTLYPYLIVHLRSLGFTIEDASIVNTAVPLADIIAPPAAGILADKMGNFRLFMAAITFLNGVSSLLLLTVESIAPNIRQEPLSLELCCNRDEVRNETFCFPPSLHLNLTFLGENETFNGLDGRASLFQSDLALTCKSEGETFKPKMMSNESSSMMSDDICLNANCTWNIFQNSGKSEKKSNNWMLVTFWHYMGIRVLLDVFRASSLMLFEGAVVAIIKEQGGDYGLQKLFGTFGGVIFGPLSGQLIDLQQSANKDKPPNAYTAVILLYFALRTVTAVCLLKLNLDFKPPAKKVVKNVWQVMKKLEVMAFLFAFLISGILWGFLENFLFWLLEDMGSTKFLMGMSLAVGTVAGLPLTVFSGLIVKKLGYQNIMILSLLLYSVRLAGYSLITTPEWFLLFESLKPFCTTLLLIATFSFIKTNSPLTTAAAVESIFGSCYFGVGRGIGGLIGGFSIDKMGAIVSFRIIAGVAMLTALIYGIVVQLRKCWGSEKYNFPKQNVATISYPCVAVSYSHNETTLMKETNKINTVE